MSTTHTASNGDVLVVDDVCKECCPCIHGGLDALEIAQWVLDHHMDVPGHFALFVRDGKVFNPADPVPGRQMTDAELAELLKD